MSESNVLAWYEVGDEQEQGPEPEYDYPVACTLVHEHEERTCAAPPLAELTLDAVRAELLDVLARIDGSFEDDADRQWALEQTRGRLAALLGTLGVVQLHAPILGSEDGCGRCGAHWSWSPWASEADRTGRRREHAAQCPALAGEQGAGH